MDHSIADELLKLKGLVDNGIITEAEFEQQKRKLLSQTGDDTLSEDCQYSIKMMSTNSKSKTEAAKEISEIVGVSIFQALDAIDKIPTTLKTGLTKDKAEEIRSLLEQAGVFAVVHSGEDTHNTVSNKDVESINRRFEDHTPVSMKVHCPYCHSTNVEKITTGKRVVKGLLWGAAAANTLVKEWHCKNCKSNF